MPGPLRFPSSKNSHRLAARSEEGSWRFCLLCASVSQLCTQPTLELRSVGALVGSCLQADASNAGRDIACFGCPRQDRSLRRPRSLVVLNRSLQAYAQSHRQGIRSGFAPSALDGHDGRLGASQLSVFAPARHLLIRSLRRHRSCPLPHPLLPLLPQFHRCITACQSASESEPTELPNYKPFSKPSPRPPRLEARG